MTKDGPLKPLIHLCLPCPGQPYLLTEMLDDTMETICMRHIGLISVLLKPAGNLL